MAKGSLLGSENVLEYPSEEYIPYACYIDKQTILTKNSDLMMVFKIPSFISNKTKVDLYDVRDNFRLILSTLFKNQAISFYFTTVRKKADIIPYGYETNYFSKTVSDIWNTQNDWYNQFVNEIYITVIISQDAEDNLFNPLFFFTSLTQTGVSSLYSKRIKESHKKLKKFANAIHDKMSDYDIRILSMVEGKDGVIYSEHMRFFSLLVNLEKGRFPITYDGISDVLRTKKLVFGGDMIEVDKSGDKRFASVMSIKSFQNTTLSQIDKILQLPMELIVTETATFIDNKFVLSKYEKQKEMVSLSEDVNLAYISGLDDLISSDSGKDVDYCIGQTTIMVINKIKVDLIDNIKVLYKSLDEIGLVAVKENVFLPTIFWSQLPGNFRYLKRLNIAPSNKLASYVSLFNFPTGKLSYNYWGNAITVIPTALNTPYFFNFHNQRNGNTVIVGLEDMGKTTIMNFLLSQTSKINPRIFYIDTKRNSEIFINALGGKYYKLSPTVEDGEEMKINPFILPQNTNNKDFLIEFIQNLVGFQDDGFIEMGQEETQLKSQYKYIPDIVDRILLMDPEKRTFANIAELFKKNDTILIYNKLSVWYKKPNTSFIFDNPTNINYNDRIIGISLRTVYENKNILIPVVQFLLHMVESIADGKPFILAIDDAWELIDNKIIAPKFINLLQDLCKKNVATIVTTTGDGKLTESSINMPINEYFATEIYLANPKISSYQKKVFSLKEEESRILSLMKPDNRNFLLKCIQDIIISSINLKDFGYYKNIFSNDNISINAMKKAKQTCNSSNPEVWIPVFIKILEEYEKAVRLKRAKENEIKQLKWEEARSDENNRNKILSSS